MHNFKPLRLARVVWKNNRLFSLDANAFYLDETDDAEIVSSVFFAADEIEKAISTQGDLVILDPSFDLGLNFLLCLFFKKHIPLGRLHFVTVVESPLQKEDFRHALAMFPQYQKEVDLLLGRWPTHTPGLHRIIFAEHNATLDVFFGEPLGFLGNWNGRFHLALLGGFTPVQRPSFWKPKLYYLLAQRAHPAATIVSKYVEDSVGVGLKRAGFKLDLSGKFMIARSENNGESTEKMAGSRLHTQSKRVVVVGAGMAGVWAAVCVALEGFDVVLLDSADGICNGASGNPAGAFHPHLSIDDARVSKITRVGLRATLASLTSLTEAGLLKEGRDWSRTGHVQLFDDEQDEARFTKALCTLKFPCEWVSLVDQRQASERLGFQTRVGGLYFSEGGWLKPKAWCRAALAYVELKRRANEASGIGNIEFKPHSHIESAEIKTIHLGSTTRQHVELVLSDVRLLADHVVIAAAQNSLHVFDQAGVIVNTVKGQVSVLNMEKPLKTVLSGASYAISFEDKRWLIGATFERPCKSLEVTFKAHEENHQKLMQVFPFDEFEFPVEGRSALRCAWLDRLPAIGNAINDRGEDIPSVLYATGFGSRGMTWAVLAGELLAARLTGRPSPLTQDLEAAVLPGRFFSRASNSKPTPPSGFSTK